MRECFSEHEARARNESERWDAVLASVREYTFNSSTRSTIDRSGLGEGEGVCGSNANLSFTLLR